MGLIGGFSKSSFSVFIRGCLFYLFFGVLKG